MKDIITFLTEYVGQEIAQRINKNMIDEMLNENYEDIDFKQFMKDLHKEDPALCKKVQEYMKKSQSIKNNKKPTTSSHGGWEDVSCGRSGSCGGYSNRHYSGGGCSSSRSYC